MIDCIIGFILLCLAVAIVFVGIPALIAAVIIIGLMLAGVVLLIDVASRIGRAIS